jgi:hypothetical protein
VRERYIQWFNEHNADAATVDEDDAVLLSALAKREETALKLALLFALIREATNGVVIPETIEAEDLERAIGVTEWLKAEGRRVLGEWGGTGDDRLLRWIVGQGGQASIRDIQRHLKASKVEEALAAVIRLENAGHGKRFEVQTGKPGPKPMMFKLC